jgi:molybdopterin synthase catalytic subunit
MALKQMCDLAAAARQRWPVVKLALLHRTGRVEIGKPSVVIAVSCPHRVQAFEACRFIIDALKKEVAIWKKEIWADGSGTWVEGNVE